MENATEPTEERRDEEREVTTAMTGEELAAVRELALRAHPDAVPELVTGGSVGELIASLEPAQAAFRRIAEAVGGTAAPAREPAASGVPTVPAGDAPRLAVDPDALPAAEKIRRGLAGRHRQS